METDEELFNRFLYGGKNELTELVNRYGDCVTRYIKAIIGDEHDAEDLMIEAFSRMCLKRPSLSRGGFRPYLYKTARNLALRFAARNRVHRHFGFEDAEFEPICEELTDQIIQKNERNQTLQLCMEKLSPDYREALYLIYYEDLSRAEAASVMQKNEKQIENLLYRGKKSLRALLEGEGITNA